MLEAFDAELRLIEAIASCDRRLFLKPDDGGVCITLAGFDLATGFLLRLFSFGLAPTPIEPGEDESSLDCSTGGRLKAGLEEVW